MLNRCAVALVLTVASLILLSNTPAPKAGPGIMAGAARVMITPPLSELPSPYTKIGDDLYLRAALIESGGKRAAIVIIDSPTIVAGTHDDMKHMIAKATGTPVDNVMLGTTHTHNSIRIDSKVEGILLPGSPRFVEQVKAATLQALKLAKANMKSARVANGNGKAYLVTNRNQWSYTLNRYIEGVDRSGNQPIDHNVGVLKLEDMAGKPIAYLVNYALNPVIAMALKDEISGDVPGHAARYVEKRFNDEAVVMFTISSASAPLYRNNTDSRPDAIHGAPDARELIRAMGTSLVKRYWLYRRKSSRYLNRLSLRVPARN
jgi:neutral ceramidase